MIANQILLTEMSAVVHHSLFIFDSGSCLVQDIPAGKAGPSSLGVPGVPWHTQYLADQLTLFQPGGSDYTQLITTGTPGFSDLPRVLQGI